MGGFSRVGFVEVSGNGVGMGVLICECFVID